MYTSCFPKFLEKHQNMGTVQGNFTYKHEAGLCGAVLYYQCMMCIWLYSMAVVIEGFVVVVWGN